MADNDNKQTVYTSTGMFGGMIKGVYCCKCCEADLTNVDKLSHKCNDHELFRTALKYRQMLEDICNAAHIMTIFHEDEDENYDETILAKDTVNLAREVLGWEKV